MNTCCPKSWLRFFKAACDEQRQKILVIIKSHRSLNASQIVEKMHLSQPTVSHHLKILSEASLVDTQKKGKEVYYSINKNNIASCCTGFMKLFSSKTK